MSVKDVLDKLADWREKSNPGVTVATVDVRTKTVRRALKLKAKDPLEYRGLKIVCRGSKKWRQSQYERGEMGEAP